MGRRIPLNFREIKKFFQQQTKLIKKSYKKMSPQGYRSEGYTLVTDALKVKILLNLFSPFSLQSEK